MLNIFKKRWYRWYFLPMILFSILFLALIIGLYANDRAKKSLSLDRNWSSDMELRAMQVPLL